MHVLVALTALFASITLLVMSAQDSTPRAMLFHSAGNLPALAICKSGMRVFARAPWFAGTLAAVRRIRADAMARRE